MGRRVLLWVMGLGLFGCGGDDGAIADGGADASTTGSGSESGQVDVDTGGETGSVGTSSDTSGGGSEETGEPEDIPPPPATGIQIVEVTFDQGIRVPIARDSELVGPNERNQPILKGRPAVMRAFYETDPGYATRTLYGVLHVIQADDTEVTYESFVQTSQMQCDQPWIYECRYGSATGSFVWRIDADQVQPGMSYWIELFEIAPGHENDVSDKIPRFPVDDGASMAVGVEDSYMKMRVVIVPFKHALGPECPEAPDLLEEFGTDYEGNPRTVADFFGERLLALNPADEVEMIVHDVVDFTGSMQGSQLLGALQQLRSAENAPPGHYYYGVARPCDGGPDFAGVAQLGGPSPYEANSRVGWGVYYANVGTTANTFVHEIGHEQGRRHIACSGQEGGPDTSYPDHPEGDTESWGMDIMAQPVSIVPPTAHDYMTYCGTAFVSEWGWTKVLPWIEEISSWEMNGPPPDHGAAQPLLYGRVAADGDTQWWIGQGWFDPGRASNDHAVRFSAGGSTVAQTSAVWTRYEKSDDWHVVVPIPADSWSEVDALTLIADGQQRTIDKSSIAVLGGATAFTQ